MEAHIGCSGFHYAGWKGSFYPEDLPKRRWFEFYAQQFKTLELNVTFYRFPRVETLKKWYADAPSGFRFSVKAPRAITHFKQFHDTERMLSDFYDTIAEGLQEKLGPVLFQFPPRFRYDNERLDRILGQMNPAFSNVLEFRHADWWRGEVFDALAQQKVCFCGMSYPGLPEDIIINTDFAYYRFHGVPKLYHSSYSRDWLSAFAGQVKAESGVREGWFYFNNDASGAAVPNTRTLCSFFD